MNIQLLYTSKDAEATAPHTFFFIISFISQISFKLLYLMLCILIILDVSEEMLTVHRELTTQLN